MPQFTNEDIPTIKDRVRTLINLIHNSSTNYAKYHYFNNYIESSSNMSCRTALDAAAEYIENHNILEIKLSPLPAPLFILIDIVKFNLLKEENYLKYENQYIKTIFPTISFTRNVQ